MFWGLTPALDLQGELKMHSTRESDEVNLLIIGGCDARHILMTLSRAHRHGHKFLNIYVIDGCPELIARQLVLLSIAFEHPQRCGLLDKSRTFLEVYGNSLIRSTTARYLSAKSNHLIKMITNLEYMKKILPMISLENVKYRERDYMEVLLKFWTTGFSNQFDMCKLWNTRIRESLGVRYDSREGVFDWDYHMRLRDVGGNQICPPEYKHFREHGVAFTWLETEVCRPNCSLAAGVFSCGERFIHRGYLGDIVTGPYVTYGLDCEDKTMLKSSNGVNFKRSTDVSERNLISMFYELEKGKIFDPKKYQGDTEHNLGAVIIANIDANISEESNLRHLNLNEDENAFINIGYSKINFHSLSHLENMSEKQEFEKKFDLVFIGHNTFNRVRAPYFKIVRDDGLLIFESRKFLIEQKREDIKSFGQQILDLATSIGCTSVGSFDPAVDEFAKFQTRVTY